MTIEQTTSVYVTATGLEWFDTLTFAEVSHATMAEKYPERRARNHDCFAFVDRREANVTYVARVCRQFETFEEICARYIPMRNGIDEAGRSVECVSVFSKSLPPENNWEIWGVYHKSVEGEPSIESIRNGKCIVGSDEELNPQDPRCRPSKELASWVRQFFTFYMKRQAESPAMRIDIDARRFRDFIDVYEKEFSGFVIND